MAPTIGNCVGSHFYLGDHTADKEPKDPGLEIEILPVIEVWLLSEGYRKYCRLFQCGRLFHFYQHRSDVIEPDINVTTCFICKEYSFEFKSRKFHSSLDGSFLNPRRS